MTTSCFIFGLLGLLCVIFGVVLLITAWEDFRDKNN